MLDIRATHYVSPLSEVDFASVPLTVHLINVADETGLVTGRFRVYNDTTGTLIHTSDIAPLSLAAGSSVDVSALTDFDPPAPLDDTYFVVFDGNAVNSLVPDGKGIFLGAFHFDVKPGAMGPPPATHASSHERAGADPIEPSDMGTSELDTTLHLKPDGAGGTHWVPGITGFDHGALTGLADDDHPQYMLRYPVFYESDLLPNQNVLGAPAAHPWATYQISSGTYGFIAGTVNHPGITRLSSSIAANSGCNLMLLEQSMLIGGTEIATFIFKPQTLALTIARIGFHSAFDTTVPSFGAYAEIAQVGGIDGVIVGKCRNGGATSTTGTSFTLATGSWYRLTISINTAHTTVTFSLLSEAGALLWSDSLSTNIPTSPIGHNFLTFNTGTTALVLFQVDYLSLQISRALTR
jgi:hypothetical protein